MTNKDLYRSRISLVAVAPNSAKGGCSFGFPNKDATLDAKLRLLCIGVLDTLAALGLLSVEGESLAKANSLIVRCGFGYSVFVYICYLLSR
jgi:hypothetical protein